MEIAEREREFRKKVQEIGGLTYTPTMLSRFADHWSEPDRAKGKAQKMKFEKQKTFEINRRLGTWARNNFDKIQCYLSDSEKTIVQKKRDLALALEPYLPKYGRETLNAFYKYWSQPENKPQPERLRWEAESFWSIETRLSQWAERNKA